jgi:aminoglycoside phosphotransferase (APT) family kinase protein
VTDSLPLAVQLQHVLGRRVENLRRLSGGASRETWAFDVADFVDVADVADASHANNALTPLILRRDPPHGARIGGMPLEARLFAAASQVGVPVPKLIASGDADPSLLDTGFLVMEHITGETIARKILRDEPYAHARSVVVGQLGAAIARLHGVDPTSIEGLVPLDPLVKYRELLDSFEQPSPTFELAYRWLLANRPEPIPAVVVHGDYRSS